MYKKIKVWQTVKRSSDHHVLSAPKVPNQGLESALSTLSKTAQFLKHLLTLLIIYIFKIFNIEFS